MTQLIVRRIVASVPVLLIVSLMVFSLTLMVPGDPAVTLAGEDASQEEIEAIRITLGLNDPVVVQYWRWVSSAAQGDLGRSLFTNQDVTAAILQRTPATLSLAFTAIVLAFSVGVPLGLLAGTFQSSRLDRIMSFSAAAGLAVPNYLVGMLLILLFSVTLGWLPATSYVPLQDDLVTWARHIILPAISLALLPAAVIVRQLRASMIQVQQLDYIRTARAKGLRERMVIFKHAFKNAANPVVTAFGIRVAFLLGGTVIVERIFAIPGIGMLTVTAVQARDLPIIQGTVIFTTLMVLFSNLLVDLAYGWLNPKVRVH